MPDKEEEYIQTLASFGIRKIADHPAADRFMEEHFAKADAWSDEEFLERWNARRAKYGLPPNTMEEYLLWK